MKTIMMCLIISILVACGKQSSQQDEAGAIQDANNVVTVKPSREACLQIDAERNTDFMITMDSDFYLIQGQEVYHSDFKALTKLSTQNVSLSGHCTLDVVDGQLRAVVLPKVSTCGGVFQPACPIQQPTPYICGPQGQICY